jgi:hypothetical protein
MRVAAFRRRSADCHVSSNPLPSTRHRANHALLAACPLCASGRSWSIAGAGAVVVARTVAGALRIARVLLAVGLLHPRPGLRPHPRMVPPPSLLSASRLAPYRWKSTQQGSPQDMQSWRCRALTAGFRQAGYRWRGAQKLSRAWPPLLPNCLAAVEHQTRVNLPGYHTAHQAHTPVE